MKASEEAFMWLNSHTHLQPGNQVTIVTNRERNGNSDAGAELLKALAAQPEWNCVGGIVFCSESGAKTYKEKHPGIVVTSSPDQLVQFVLDR